MHTKVQPTNLGLCLRLHQTHYVGYNMNLRSASVMNRIMATMARPKTAYPHSMGMDKLSILTYIKGHQPKWHSKGLHIFQARRNIYNASRCRRARG